MLPAKSVSPAMSSLERSKVQADRALRVPGRVQHLGGIAVETDDEPVAKNLIGRRGFRRCNSEPAGLLFHHLQQRQVVFVEQDWRAGKPLELERAAHVVDVARE